MVWFYCNGLYTNNSRSGNNLEGSEKIKVVNNKKYGSIADWWEATIIEEVSEHTNGFLQ